MQIFNTKFQLTGLWTGSQSSVLESINFPSIKSFVVGLKGIEKPSHTDIMNINTTLIESYCLSTRNIIGIMKK